MIKKVSQNKQGISLILTILILSSLTILTLTISDVVLRTGRSTESIANSEVAYFAAETAVEKALYDVETSYSITNLNVSTPQQMSATKATWTRTVIQNNAFSISCATLGNNEGICSNNTAAGLSASNPMYVKLNAGSSFQIDLRYAGLTLPNTMHVTWSSGTAKIILSQDSGQTTYTSSPFNTGSTQSNIRIINTGASLATFQIKPANGDLAQSILITGVGNYKNYQRTLELEKRIWQIY